MLWGNQAHISYILSEPLGPFLREIRMKSCFVILSDHHGGVICEGESKSPSEPCGTWEEIFSFWCCSCFFFFFLRKSCVTGCTSSENFHIHVCEEEKWGMRGGRTQSQERARSTRLENNVSFVDKRTTYTHARPLKGDIDAVQQHRKLAKLIS